MQHWRVLVQSLPVTGDDPCMLSCLSPCPPLETFERYQTLGLSLYLPGLCILVLAQWWGHLRRLAPVLDTVLAGVALSFSLPGRTELGSANARWGLIKWEWT